MGGTLSQIPAGNNKKSPATEGGISLSNSEKKAIRRTWKIVTSDLKNNGTALFIRFFERFPEHRNFFPAFNGMSSEELSISLVLRAHGTTVMYSFMSVVENIDDPGVFVELMKKLVKNHHNRGITVEAYEDMFVVFLDFLEEKLGDDFNVFAQNSWRQLINVILSVIRECMTANTNNID